MGSPVGKVEGRFLIQINWPSLPSAWSRRRTSSSARASAAASGNSPWGVEPGKGVGSGGRKDEEAWCWARPRPEVRRTLHRLAEIGFLPGEVVEIVARAGGRGGPIAVRVGGSTFALRAHEAALLRVREPA